MKASTALALENTIQSNVPALRARLVERRRSRPAAAMRIIGASIASRAQRLEAARRARPPARAGRVTRMRLPNSGRASNQRRCSRSADDAPDDEDRRPPVARRSDRRADLVERADDASPASAACRRR